ncbi:MAG: ABC transporter ATP-binding protein [Oscillospiraceae bacterium]|nr:ABC transporter ATP-binding protein [Oscillospiraceae bacterium]MDD6083757.1 ABC transporter ATP-binding protein [Oscillospiraceae bacterium]
MIKVDNLSKIYGSGESAVRALNRVSFQIDDGEMVAVIGASGSGKSTLLHILGGLDTSAQGNVFYDNTDILKMNDIRLSEFRLKNIGFVFQFFNLIPELTAEENIKLPQMMCKKKPVISKDLISTLGIENRLKHYPDELSGGQKQRVAIARALANNPKAIFADEPTGALDTKTSSEIMNLFKILNQKGKTIIIVTHDMEIAKQCGRIIEISDGKII